MALVFVGRLISIFLTDKPKLADRELCRMARAFGQANSTSIAGLVAYVDVNTGRLKSDMVG